MNIKEIIKELERQYNSCVSKLVPVEYEEGYLEALRHVQEKIDDNEANKTNFIDLTVFGSELKTYNKHWLKTHARFLNFLSEFDMINAHPILKYKFPSNPLSELDNECIREIDILFCAGDFDIEGYTLREVSKIFLAYAHQWWDDNLVLQRKHKIEQIEKLKKELEELESSLK